MKKLVITTLLFISTQLTYGQVTLGLGLSYGTDIERPAINVRGGYFFTEQVHGNVGLNYFLLEQSDGFRSQFYGFNVNASYRFMISPEFHVYPLAGVNSTTISVSTDIGGEKVTAKETKVGLNLGGGLGYRINNIAPFFEGKWVFSEYDQAVLTAGLIFYLDN